MSISTEEKVNAVPIPRWIADPDQPVRDRVVAAALPGELVDAPAALLAAHAAALRRLTGEAGVQAGLVVTPGEDARPCRLTAAGTWRELTHAAAATIRRAEPGDASSFETVVDLTGELTRLPSGVVASMSLDPATTRLRLTCRGDIADADYADRLLGYHLAALHAMVRDPNAFAERETLLSEAEARFQREDLAGPCREVPDLRFHQLFEQRASRQPDAIAAVCADRRLTYRELNHDANRIARALLARGVRAEDVVAVVTERDLTWLACVIAVFKVGGCYLPIEPHFPAERVATMVRRSGCRFALTEPRSAAVLTAAELPDLIVLTATECAAGDTANVDVAVTPDQLAYVYFTSGSTGEPKGAMCEHAGLLNHLLAKIGDLGIGAGTVVAQTAPQCFDISLWQLVSALVVGGTTVIVEQDSVLDVDRFVADITAAGVEVLQVVPSYLDLLLARFVAREGDLGSLRVVSTTGEPLKKELVRRWFARFPDITVVNAYGLTETSDDTNHEVLTAAPDGDRVPLGRPVNNVRVEVVDEWLRPVPLGAPGEIVFSGVCVGRGYINDEQRTAASFLVDPARPGERCYRSGDFGRWRPDRKLEFLGRRDTQVKIRGFRVEIDEVENHLLRLAGVRDAAVVVTGTGQERGLVGFYRATGIGTEDIRAALTKRLPDYLVPARLHRLDVLPLTGNGKIDKKALGRIADDLAQDTSARSAPDTATERRVAREWSTVLGIPVEKIGRQDDFFARGGTSLTAIRLLIALGRVVSLTELAAHPVLADLADLVDRRTELPHSPRRHA